MQAMSNFPFRSGLLCAAALLLPSCTGWVESNIGTCIRESGLVHTAADVRHPVDGTIYQTTAQRKAQKGYVRAPEITYRMSHPLFIHYDVKGMAWDIPEPYDIRPTGRQHCALVSCANDGNPGKLEKIVERIPAHARPRPARGNEERAPWLHDLGEPPSPSWWRYAAAAPFDYALEPLITITANVTEYVGGLVILPFWLLYAGIDSCVNES